MAGHRYWRLFFDTGNSGNISASKIELHATPGGPNVAVGGHGTASSSYFDPSTANAVWGGTTGTPWASTSGSNEWIAYDLGAGVTQNVVEVAYTTRLDGSPEQSPQTGRLQYSNDGTTWVDASSSIGWGQRWGAPQTKIYTIGGSGTGHRYWRVNISANRSNSYVRLQQVVLRAVTNGPPVTLVGFPSRSTAYDGNYEAANAFSGLDDARQWCASAGPPQWIAFDFGAGCSYSVIELAMRSTQSDSPDYAPTAGDLSYSDDGNTWTQLFPWTINFTATDQLLTAVATPPAKSNIAASEGRVFTVLTKTTAGITASEARSIFIYTYPASATRVSSGKLTTVTTSSKPMEVSEAQVFALVKYRTANPRIRAWTFTLDGHDFYVLRLGDAATLVYDVSSKQWVQWDTPAHGVWRPSIGTTWTGAHKLANDFGTNIVAGDDEFGLLWFLDPVQPYDDGVSGGYEAFTRTVTGQVLANGRQQIPCYAIFVDGDNYGITAKYFQPFVRLDTSDDQGRTFDQHDTLTIDGDNAQPDTWYSLGQFGSPGRIFRLTDNGVFARIDAMDMNDDAG